ncbi:hypothetical protein ERC79_12230 [Rhodococcus sp. ABRD24]|uniref:hypothetical protein n=1 Tax=Rhodococcus sp. ABRD24 TaxID=2507582 RepID=UPI00103E4B4A|nr:hypothetical protein [Rhodococcus sp. ABRD24]QBJ96649.1 hypothetical protein ERC79_12230 [Rhodococcus sp. ABRD24]
MSEIQPAASDENFELLRQEPFFEVVVDLVAGYLASAFDDAASGEVDEWTLTCFPATNRTADSERLFTLNIGPMETLYVERYTDNGETVDYRTVLYTSLSALMRRTGYSLDGLTMANPLLRFRKTELASADGDGVVIDWFLSDEGADDQFFGLPLDETTIRPLAERLVDKGRGPYARYHNRRFAQHVLDVMKEDV